VVFTGGLSLRRTDAGKIARKAGAILENEVSRATDKLGETVRPAAGSLALRKLDTFCNEQSHFNLTGFR
jgi:hypothetical protein